MRPSALLPRALSVLKVLTIVTSLMVMVEIQVAAAEVPRTLTYQGVLKRSNGSPLPNGGYEVTFRIYDVEDGGSALWAETDSVTVYRGTFSAILGKQSPLDLDFDETYWIGITVGAGSELSPRLELTSVAYAFRAAIADSIAGGGGDDGDWVIAGSDLYSAVSGNVGIGTGNPVEKLQVAGNVLVDSTAEMSGFRMPTGATSGYVLTSDATGAGTWEPGGGGGGDNDWSGAGTGTMYATNASDDVGIGTSTPTAKLGIQGSGTDAVGILCTHNHGVHVVHAAANGIEVDDAATDGVGIINPGSDGVRVATPAHDGVEVTDAGVSGVIGHTAGTGFGVFGQRKDAPTGGTVPSAGVGGASKVDPGVAGFSDDSDGVFGQTNKAGTFSSLSLLTGGVHGKPRSDYQTDADNFAVVGTRGDYSSTGVLGVGGQKGHGVVGTPGGHTQYTTAGVRGITIEGGWPPSDFPLTEGAALSKEQVGVLGQSKQFVAVWGESVERVGVAGTSGTRKALSDVADTSGVWGYSDAAYGVVGQAELDSPDKAGVKAVGAGTSGAGVPKAAALEIENGALRVSGQDRPSRIERFTPSWSPNYTTNDPASCAPGPCTGHQHITSYFAYHYIYNNLIIPESIIQLTVQAEEPMFAQLVDIENGRTKIQVTAVTPLQPNEEVGIHYLIINPK